MTRIFVYEHISAQGLGREPDSPGHSLFVEGRAMFGATCEDFAAITGVEVLVGSSDDFGKLAAESDWSFVIAPETDGVLLRLANEVERVGGRWLGPSPDAIALASDKFAMYRHWKQRGVRTPETVLVPELPPSWPCVVKRRDGAGSEGMRLVRTEAEYWDLSGSMIAQPFCPGIPVSIAFLIGPHDTIALPPCFQLISTDGQFRYGGGLLPIAPELAARAERLGRVALVGVPELLGYIGVDLILGDTADAREDFAVEINPRLTTSYVGLRAWFDGNLMELLLDLMSRPRELPHSLPRSTIRRVAFSASGNIRIDTFQDHWVAATDPNTAPANPPRAG